MYKSIYVPVDNSDHSNRAVPCSLALGKAFNAKLAACHVYAAKLHDYRFRQMEYTLPEEDIDEVELERQRKIHQSLITMGFKLNSDRYFNGIVGVLTEQAAKVFRFEEQNQLHEEIIDTGLAQIYQSHLEVGERMASEMGIEIKKTLLDGKPFQKILDHARKTNPWLLVLGRIGVHSPKAEKALGSNVENILRGAPCDVLLSTRLEVPRLDVRAEETIRWTPEAEARMTRVPAQVKGIARTGVLRLALEKGHSVVTSAVIDEAMDRFMPKGAQNATKALAEAVALERARSGSVSMCRACGVTATQSGARKCTRCGSTDFDVISPEMIERIAEVEGGLEEETTYDGRKLRWTEEARKGLWTMKNAYQRRRVKSRVAKSARMKRLDTITLGFARQVIEEETGAPLDIKAPSADMTRARATGATSAEEKAGAGAGSEAS